MHGPHPRSPPRPPAYRTAVPWPGLLGLRAAVVRWLFALHPRRDRGQTLPHRSSGSRCPWTTARTSNAVVIPADPDAGRMIAGLLAGRRVALFDGPVERGYAVASH